MNPTLSVIVTNHNYTHCLPRLLASLEMQTFSDFEILIVDDCSRDSCDEIVAHYQKKGLSIRIVKQEKRVYAKNAYAIGAEESQGKIISFIDADDYIVEPSHFAIHTAILLSTDADIVHFKARVLDKQGKQVARGWDDPCIEGSLESTEIFDTLTETKSGKILAMGLWDKFWKRDFFVRCLSAAKQSKVRRCSADTFFNLLLLPLAQKYVGTGIASYGYERTLRGPRKTLGSVVSLYYALCDIPPYLEANGCPEHIIQKCTTLIKIKIINDTATYLAYVTDKSNQIMREHSLTEMAEYHEYDEYIPTLLMSSYIILKEIEKKKIINDTLKKELAQLKKATPAHAKATKRSGAAAHVKGLLAYRFGEILINNSRSFTGWLGMPIALIRLYRTHLQEKKQRGGMPLPVLADFDDAHEGRDLCKTLTYRTGKAFVDNITSPSGWFRLPGLLRGVARERRKLPIPI